MSDLVFLLHGPQSSFPFADWSPKQTAANSSVDRSNRLLVCQCALSSEFVRGQVYVNRKFEPRKSDLPWAERCSGGLHAD